MTNGVDYTNEHDEVVWYVLKRKLIRPELTFIKAFFILLRIILLNVLILFVAYYSLVFILTPFFIRINKKILSLCLILIIVFIDIYIYGNKAAIGLIKLYQHYAPEHVRRKCLFKPTCSEYAILAINKYGLLIALPKIYNRIFKRCIGNKYRIDYP